MAHVVVTGGAGFVGTELCCAMAARGDRVTAVDPGRERRHARSIRRLAGAGVRLVPAGLGAVDLGRLLEPADAVVHLAGRPGVQTSWAHGFDAHLRDNVGLAQRLFEAALHHPVDRIVVASSSSVYGCVGPGTTADEALSPAPISPYGATKAALELVAGAYAARGVPIVTLRYFTVYGRGQRPDMALARMIDAAHGGPAFPLRGDGSQERDLTHVDDVVVATAAALDTPLAPGTLVNVGGGAPVTVRHLLDEVARIGGRPVPRHPVPAAPGDPRRTAADGTVAARLLGWSPAVTLEDGLADQIAAHGRALGSRSAPAVPVGTRR